LLDQPFCVFRQHGTVIFRVVIKRRAVSSQRLSVVAAFRQWWLVRSVPACVAGCSCLHGSSPFVSGPCCLASGSFAVDSA
jgi:hypothetical protein